MAAAGAANGEPGGAAPPRWRPRARTAQFPWFLLFALATRWFALGDVNYQDDELLFFYFGQRMHEGLLPYVDLWDRKPPSLFLLYYLLAGISHSVLAFQIAGLLSVAATAQIISLIAERIGARGLCGMLAGSIYMVMLLEFGGASGQAAVSFNLPMAMAALLVRSQSEMLAGGEAGRRLPAAMLLAGLTITFKQTAVFEAAFLGCFALWRLRRGGMAGAALLRTALTMMLAGASPMLAWAAFYAAIGHFGEFWHAMVTSNLTKSYDPGGDLAQRARLFAIHLAPAALVALAGLAWRGEGASREGRVFAAGWIAAAFGGFIAVPNLIDHYVLPLLAPLALAGSPFLSRRPLGWAAGAVIAGLYIVSAPTLDVTRAARSRAMMSALVGQIRAHDPAPRLFVYDGPVYLYALTGSHPPTPLAFPLHLNFRPERNVSHLDTASELRRILSAEPSTVVIQRDSRPRGLYNPETLAMVEAYVRSCRTRYTGRLLDMYGPVDLDLYSQCTGKAAAQR